MFVPLLVFVVVSGLVAGVCMAAMRLPALLAARTVDRRLREVSRRELPGEATLVTELPAGPLPSIDRLLGASGSSLARLIEQSGVRTTPSAIAIASLAAAVGTAVLAAFVVPHPLAALVAASLGGLIPAAWLRYRRAVRLRTFEEQFPEALDLLSRAIRAGHAFQTAMGMVADELPAPVGVEFRKGFDQQNFGLPLKDVLAELTTRVPILDVKFFATAVSIQRETGGNLAEILDNLAHVVRERFKILRQVRVHTAHGRFTGYVLLALPATLAVVLYYLNPDQMNLLFEERMGQLMIVGAIVMQSIGYVWIRHIIRIEV